MASNGVNDHLEKRTKEEKAIDDWLPITSDRNAKWWFSTMHNVTAMVGAGVLSLPFAMSQMGWGPGVTAMLLSWIITFYTIWQMVEMHEMIPGKRFDRYHELGQYAFGEKLGLWIVVPQQIVVEVSTCIIYMVTGGKSLKKFQDIVFPHTKPLKLTYFILFFSVIEFFLSLLPNFNSLSSVSFVAAILSITYSIVAWTTSLKEHDAAVVSYDPRSDKNSDNVFMFLSALGNVAFAYAGHNVVLEIQATIPSTPEKPSTKAMWRGVWIAYLVVAFCYLPVAFIGYWAFGNGVDDNILLTLHRPTWLIAAANIFVVVHVIGSYQVYAMPVFDMIETYAVKSLKFKPSTPLRVFLRMVFVAFTLFVALTFPFFGGLMGFFGGFALAPTSYYLPCIIWLILKKPKRFGLSWTINWLCIIVGVLLTLLSPIGGLWSIIKDAKTYHFYQ
ncbi:Lysine histidine transporter 1 [Capsicum baccatum]|uniref:Lysine histidine transporter 1 n=2 Tax=Capsicum TaxID=4071 RepID=A0A1U8EY53_CAPAN|nr:lysine histidine transporter-like 2 [Capsicum annuum]KAF3654946.1 Lysine histidine transporter 1 [Capsicum annuum]KAF3684227.1 Lysine histidine transporter 1 [Capsicum annuum]PHT35276.1 Lysine histidine transporter 1 [Capsicum baccatum]PHT69155.1 Lysine histidine transporter 1 [Capsicum annuum]